MNALVYNRSYRIAVGYEKEIELKMQRLFATLSEKDRRRYAGIEAAKLGHGGIEYISKLFGVDPKTVRRGMTELEQTGDPVPGRVRKEGGGRKTATERLPQLEGPLPQDSRRIHRRRPDAGRRVVDQPVPR
jgi:hypothetical protein